MPRTVAVGDRLCTKKQHPCGANDWLVTRTGCDIKLKCTHCGRVILLGREEFEKCFRRYISRAERSESIENR
ncbi:MAG: DUF951 domain-containing protein [Eubacteriales bacterium]|nr:DUF951 domain-containing protein [Eubacteriales bacterium]